MMSLDLIVGTFEPVSKVKPNTIELRSNLFSVSG